MRAENASISKYELYSCLNYLLQHNRKMLNQLECLNLNFRFSKTRKNNKD